MAVSSQLWMDFLTRVDYAQQKETCPSRSAAQFPDRFTELGWSRAWWEELLLLCARRHRLAACVDRRWSVNRDGEASPGGRWPWSRGRGGQDLSRFRRGAEPAGQRGTGDSGGDVLSESPRSSVQRPAGVSGLCQMQPSFPSAKPFLCPHVVAGGPLRAWVPVGK